MKTLKEIALCALFGLISGVLIELFCVAILHLDPFLSGYFTGIASLTAFNIRWDFYHADKIKKSLR